MIMCKHRKMGMGLMLLSAVFLGLTAATQAQNPFENARQFSATMVVSGATAKTGPGQGDMKIYRSGDKMRMNLGGGAGYMIVDLTQHTNYMVMGAGMCMQMTAPAQQHNPFAETQGATIERSAAGSDTVDGHPCKVENLTVTPQKGEPAKMKVWEAEDLKGFPVKTEMQSSRGPITILYKDVSFAEPEPSLFVHPENCRAMPTMPGGPPH